MAGLRDAPVSVAGQVLAEPGALALLQNTLGLYEALLVTGGDACTQQSVPLLSPPVLLPTNYTATVAVLLSGPLQTRPPTAAVKTAGDQRQS